MSLIDAEAALEEARDRHTEAQMRVSSARAHLATVRERATKGDVSPGELAAARDAVEVAELAAEGPESELAPLEEAVLNARAESECERISSTLRSLGGAAARALEAVDEALNDFAAAAVAYDGFVAAERFDAASRCERSQRFSGGGRYGRPAIDGTRLVQANPMAQLATVLLPVARTVRADTTLVEALKALAQSAPLLPRDDQ